MEFAFFGLGERPFDKPQRGFPSTGVASRRQCDPEHDVGFHNVPASAAFPRGFGGPPRRRHRFGRPPGGQLDLGPHPPGPDGRPPPPVPGHRQGSQPPRRRDPAQREVVRRQPEQGIGPGASVVEAVGIGIDPSVGNSPVSGSAASRSRIGGAVGRSGVGSAVSSGAVGSSAASRSRVGGAVSGGAAGHSRVGSAASNSTAQAGPEQRHQSAPHKRQSRTVQGSRGGVAAELAAVGSQCGGGEGGQ
ncbi:hypothetical protein SAMN04489732_11743 [Amycolatopsis saalfeldensis]|uniref:Uncharacterized protein n=1 Tax=Amycolatopsis saalfeldensis TaxID=394193 RepID=A0A1H8YHV4_9PSEU|nr:hypothetical protein SAMN04489732_11743 [Amycolatopsis saalfeldensis]